MKIAFVSTIYGYPWGGADTLWTRAAEAASDRGENLLISVADSTAESPRVAALARAGAQVSTRTPPEVPRTLARRVAGKLQRMAGRDDPIANALSEFRPDLAVFSQGGTYDLIAYPAVRRWLFETGTPFRLIANWQLEFPQLSEDAIGEFREFLSRADALFFVSTRNLEVTRRHLGIPLGNSRVVQNPLRWRESDVSPWPAEELWSLASVTRFEPVKGIDLLIEAAAKALPQEDPSWRLQLYGRGPAEAELRTLASKRGLESRVHFRGYVPELQKIWADNHLMISPAREEGVPMTIPEAMLCQRPVLATRVGGAEDWIEHGKTGYLCKADSLSDLAETLRDAWDRRSSWKTIGLEAARAAASHYRSEDFLQLIQPPHESAGSS